jgi:primosomal protein N' (replication factor Y)
MGVNYYLVSPLRVVHQHDSLLTYHSAEKLPSGTIVAVEVGNKEVPGVVIKEADKPSFDTKPIERVVEQTPLPVSLLELHYWLASYYASHPVAVWQTMLPSGLLKKRRSSVEKLSYPKRSRTKIVLNTEQQEALERITDQPTGTHLLHGITGSGKTAIYVELAKQTIASGKSVIVLVPEIALTSQIIAEFVPHFPDLIVTHSHQTEAQRHKAWLEALHSETPRVVIGPRSALFTPFTDLGLIVIDEAHEPSFKQEKSPRYSALRAASVLAKHTCSRLVLGSATPNISDYYVAAAQDEAVIELANAARPDTILPTTHVVDMTKKDQFRRSSFLSEAFIEGIELALRAGHQSLVFHNRRGSSPITLCENCGWSAACPRCFVPLTLHADTYELRCHLCNHTDRVPTSCPDCGHANIIHKGIGTKRIVEELEKLFRGATIRRFDGDTHQKEGVDTHYQALYDGDIDIIVGTQVVAKGLDLPKLRFVGVVQADSGLALPDYLSSERVFQLLAQVSGRVGRNEHPSSVVVQSYQPDHPSVRFGLTRDYHGFYESELQERKRAHFPPFTHLLKLVCIYKTEQACVRAARILHAELRQKLPGHVEILGPTPAFYERVRDSYRWQLIVKSPQRSDLVSALSLVPPTHWQSELDPMSLL